MSNISLVCPCLNVSIAHTKSTSIDDDTRRRLAKSMAIEASRRCPQLAASSRFARLFLQEDHATADDDTFAISRRMPISLSDHTASAHAYHMCLPGDSEDHQQQQPLLLVKPKYEMLIGEWRCSSSSTTADDSDTHTVTVSKCLVCHTWTHCSIVHRQGGSDAAAVLVILNRKQLIRVDSPDDLLRLKETSGALYSRIYDIAFPTTPSSSSSPSDDQDTSLDDSANFVLSVDSELKQQQLVAHMKRLYDEATETSEQALRQRIRDILERAGGSRVLLDAFDDPTTTAVTTTSKPLVEKKRDEEADVFALQDDDDDDDEYDDLSDRDDDEDEDDDDDDDDDDAQFELDEVTASKSKRPPSANRTTSAAVSGTDQRVLKKRSNNVPTLPTPTLTSSGKQGSPIQPPQRHASTSSAAGAAGAAPASSSTAAMSMRRPTPIAHTISSNVTANTTTTSSTAANMSAFNKYSCSLPREIPMTAMAVATAPTAVAAAPGGSRLLDPRRESVKNYDMPLAENEENEESAAATPALASSVSRGNGDSSSSDNGGGWVPSREANALVDEDDDDDDDEHGTKDMGRAISALASSIVAKDGRELFGGVPSRRVPINSISQSYF